MNECVVKLAKELDILIDRVKEVIYRDNFITKTDILRIANRPVYDVEEADKYAITSPISDDDLLSEILAILFVNEIMYGLHKSLAVSAILDLASESLDIRKDEDNESIC